MATMGMGLSEGGIRVGETPSRGRTNDKEETCLRLLPGRGQHPVCPLQEAFQGLPSPGREIRMWLDLETISDVEVAGLGLDWASGQRGQWMRGCRCSGVGLSEQGSGDPIHGDGTRRAGWPEGGNQNATKLCGQLSKTKPVFKGLAPFVHQDSGDNEQ